MTKTVLILGQSGKIGTHAAAAFWNAGWQVRSYKRGTDMTQAAQGCDVIVNGLNPPNYHNWSEILPQITRQVIAAAKATGATVILPGNVYNFGQINGEIAEDTPQTPNSRKGQIRKDIETQYRRSGVQTIVLRAGNFIDPDRNGCIMSTVVMRAAKADKLTSPGAPDLMQPYCYLPDWARAAEMLASRRGALAQFDDIPFPGHAFTLNELRDALTEITGRQFRIAGFPWWLMTMTAPVWELARELREMRYLWGMSHTLSGQKFGQLLPEFQPTDLRMVMTAGLPPQVDPNQTVRASKAHIAAE